MLLKVLRSAHFSALVDFNSGQRLFNSSISALRKISVSNNDLPGRLSDVLAYLWNHPNPQIIVGEDRDGLQLKIRSRMSMSIVYDSLWLWRDQFLVNGTTTGNAATGRKSKNALSRKTNKVQVLHRMSLLSPLRLECFNLTISMPLHLMISSSSKSLPFALDLSRDDWSLDLSHLSARAFPTCPRSQHTSPSKTTQVGILVG